jgi:hypothetical protein
MRIANNLALIGAILLSAGIPSGAAAESTFADQLEMLEWSDPERAAQILDAAPPLSADSSAEEVEMLAIRGMIYADNTRDDDVNAVMQRLDAIAREGVQAAVRARRFVRAYSARQHSQFAAAEIEIKGIDIASIGSDAEHYRVLSLRGHVFRILGQDDAALPFLERALDVANKMHHDLRILHAMLALASIYIDSGAQSRHRLGRRGGIGGNRRARKRHSGSPRRSNRGTARGAGRTRAREALGQQ